MFNGLGVEVMCFSVYLNMIASSSGNNIIVFIDYEYFRIVGTYILENDKEVSDMMFFTNYSVLLISTNQGDIVFLHIENRYLRPCEVIFLYRFDINHIFWD